MSDDPIRTHLQDALNRVQLLKQENADLETALREGPPVERNRRIAFGILLLVSAMTVYITWVTRPDPSWSRASYVTEASP
jgi:hypothetical protein